MPRKFDRDAKDRVVRLVEDRILAENMSMQQACKIVRGMLPGNGRRQPAVLGASQNQGLKMWPPNMRGYAVKITSYATLMSY